MSQIQTGCSQGGSQVSFVGTRQNTRLRNNTRAAAAAAVNVAAVSATAVSAGGGAAASDRFPWLSALGARAGGSGAVYASRPIPMADTDADSSDGWPSDIERGGIPLGSLRKRRRVVDTDANLVALPPAGKESVGADAMEGAAALPPAGKEPAGADAMEVDLEKKKDPGVSNDDVKQPWRPWKSRVETGARGAKDFAANVRVVLRTEDQLYHDVLQGRGDLGQGYDLPAQYAQQVFLEFRRRLGKQGAKHWTDGKDLDSQLVKRWIAKFKSRYGLGPILSRRQRAAAAEANPDY